MALTSLPDSGESGDLDAALKVCILLSYNVRLRAIESAVAAVMRTALTVLAAASECAQPSLFRQSTEALSCHCLLEIC